MYDVYISLSVVGVFERPLDWVKPTTVRLEMTGEGGGEGSSRRREETSRARWKTERNP